MTVIHLVFLCGKINYKSANKELRKEYVPKVWILVKKNIVTLQVTHYSEGNKTKVIFATRLDYIEGIRNSHIILVDISVGKWEPGKLEEEKANQH
jgi:hypothetical protein